MRNGEISRNIEKALAHATRKAINEVLARDHPQIFVRNRAHGLAEALGGCNRPRWHLQSKNTPSLTCLASGLRATQRILGWTFSINHATDRRLVSPGRGKARRVAQTTVHFVCQSPDPNR